MGLESGNTETSYRIFLSLRFYVKSKLANAESQNLPFLRIGRLWSLFFVFLQFCTFWRLKLAKSTKFKCPKMAKTSDLVPTVQNWFHVKSAWQKNHEISTRYLGKRKCGIVWVCGANFGKITVFQVMGTKTHFLLDFYLLRGNS